MPRFEWNKKYLTISLYACAVLALTIIGVTVCVYLPAIFGAIGRFFQIIAPIAFGLGLAYLISPILSFVEKKIMRYVDKKKRPPYFKRLLGLFITYIILCAVIALFGFLIFPEVIRNFDSISQNLYNNIVDIYNRLRNLLDTYLHIKIGDAQELIATFSSSIITYLADFGSKFGKFVFNFIIGLILSFFVLLHKEQLILGFKKFTAAVFPARAFNAIMKTVRLSDNIFGKFFVGKIFDSLIIGAIVLTVLAFFQLPVFPSFFHMPYFPLIAAVLCIFNVIPYVGPIIGAVPSILLVFIDNEGGFLRAMVLLIIIIAVQILDANVIEPKILGKAIGISSLWVVVSIIVLGNLWGIFGMFIAVPLFTVIYNLVGELTSRRLKKINLPTETAEYAPGEEELPAFPWAQPTEPTPDPNILSDTAEGSLEELARKPLPIIDKDKNHDVGNSSSRRKRGGKRK